MANSRAGNRGLIAGSANANPPSRMKDALFAAGIKTVGEVREMSDYALLSLPDLGKASVDHLRETLGLPSSAGVRPPSKKTPRTALAAARSAHRFGILERG
jgi:DNA-directed RNA polymerase alpha subunit